MSVITVRLTAEQKEAVNAAARAKSVSTNQWCVEVLTTAANAQSDYVAAQRNGSPSPPPSDLCEKE